MTQPKIITSHVFPPIPVRAFDWCAYRDGHEEDGNYGYGRTEEEAVADLLDNEEMMGLDLAADEAAYFDGFRDSDPVHMTPDMRALQTRIEDRYEEERTRKGGYSLRAAAARIADSQEFFNTDADGYEDPF